MLSKAKTLSLSSKIEVRSLFLINFNFENEFSTAVCDWWVDGKVRVCESHRSAPVNLDRNWVATSDLMSYMSWRSMSAIGSCAIKP